MPDLLVVDETGAIGIRPIVIVLICRNHSCPFEYL